MRTIPPLQPTFSVVIAAYQAAGTIGDAITSAREQTLAPAEIIVCDDGSTDELDRALEPHLDVVMLVREKHRGVSAARNTLLGHATADFVAPLDADDVWAPTRLERLAQLAGERPDLDILETDAHLMADGRPIGRFHPATAFAADDQPQAILDRCFLICPAVRRTALAAIGGYDEALCTAEDWDCYLRLIHAGAKAGLVDEPLLEYRLGKASLTSRRADTLLDRVRVLEKAERQPGLSAAERDAVRAALGRHRGRALQQRAREAVLEADPRARGFLLEAARSRDVPLGARAGAAAASLAPAFARRVVEIVLAQSSGRPSPP